MRAKRCGPPCFLLIEGFTKRYGVHHLVYYEMHHTMPEAILREKRLKKWNRAWKVRLIESMNPEWVDLSTISGARFTKGLPIGRGDTSGVTGWICDLGPRLRGDDVGVRNRPSPSDKSDGRPRPFPRKKGEMRAYPRAFGVCLNERSLPATGRSLAAVGVARRRRTGKEAAC